MLVRSVFRMKFLWIECCYLPWWVVDRVLELENLFTLCVCQVSGLLRHWYLFCFCVVSSDGCIDRNKTQVRNMRGCVMERSTSSVLVVVVLYSAVVFENWYRFVFFCQSHHNKKKLVNLFFFFLKFAQTKILLHFFFFFFFF